jgi:hypothetical protein
MDPEFHYLILKNPQPVRILSQISPVYIIPKNLPKSHAVYSIS